MNTQNKRKVFIMGGSRGVGAAIVKKFAEQGDEVVFSYVNSHSAAETLAQQTGSTALQLDSADRNAIASQISKLGKLDVLIVNAGVLSSGDPLTLNADEIEKLFQINIHAPYFAAVEAARQMSKDGRIVFIGSTNADRMPMQGLSAYATSKSALQGMVKGLARDFGPRGITVNVVQPGPTDTDMNPADGPLNELMHSFMAIKRHAHGDEVAAMVSWVASAEAAMVTGSALTIDGGFGA
ncbi:SDR family oxidoreductase [Serratia sp. M24T3]|uniref:SDR family oxidoreductase n=1 Tax=Serratia sp. M24T3 TaxID=932213 RepID=UPI00025BAAD5|nr:SDR family oxidoreductase [Serratia sp. M24T3]EIC85322.1 oxidoreductase [Serratia sp. M24T3]